MTVLSMGRMKQNKIIAVDTSLGTNFLISACDDATVSELRGFIQMGHFSCFPEHGSINVLALMVEYSQRLYHVTDSLLIGQIFRKKWNKIHAEVSTGTLRSPSILHTSKSTEAGSLANKKMDNLCAALDDTSLAKSAGCKSLDVDRYSNKHLAHSSSALFCGEKAIKYCNDIAPVISNSQTSWINHEKLRCSLLPTEEAPYTQSHSQLDFATRAPISKDVLNKVRKCRKRRCIKEETLGRKRKQAEITKEINHNLDRDKDTSPGKISPFNGKRDTNKQEHSGQQCRQDTHRRHELDEEVAVLKGDAQLAEAYKEPENCKLREYNILSNNVLMAGDSIQRKHSKDAPSPNSEAFGANSSKLKMTSALSKSLRIDYTKEIRSCQENLDTLEPSLSEKDFTTMVEVAVNQDVAIRGGLSCSNVSAENRAEGTEEVVLQGADRIGKMDFSMGFPIQLNDHSILLVANLSAEVVPETQESDIQIQDGKNAEGEEAVLSKRGLEVLKHTAMEPHSQDPGEPQETVPKELPFHQDMRNMKSIAVSTVTENLAFLAEKKKRPNPKPCIAVDLPSKSFSIGKNIAGNDTEFLDAHNDKCDGQSHEIGPAGGKHEIALVRKKKKRKRKKVLETHKVSMPKDSRFVASGMESQYTQSIVNPKTDAAETVVLLENPTKKHNHVQEGDSCHVLAEQAPTQLGNVVADPRQMQKQNATVLNVDEGNCKESSFAGNETVALGKVLLDPHSKSETGEKCIEGCETTKGELLVIEQEAVTEAGATCRKKKKRRKQHLLPCLEGASGGTSPKMGNESDLVPFSIKELPNVLRLNSKKEGELHQKKKAKFIGEQVTKKNSKEEMIETDPNIGLMQEQDQDNATMELANKNDQDPLLKDGLVASSSTMSPSKECFQEGMVKIKPSIDVFDFESSETVNRLKENCIDTEVTSNLEADNLEKLCAVAVKLVEDEILNSSTMTTRKSNRKAVHPKRWITVLSERLTSNQTSKTKSNMKCANKRSKPIAEDTGLSKDGELTREPLYAEEEEAGEEIVQVMVNDRRVACPAGCGKLYTKKTSAYYRHSRKCSGLDY